MAATDSIIAELEAAVHSNSRDKRIETLRRVTDLFLGGSNRFNDEQINLFDDVLVHLIRRVETKALIELSTRLAPIDKAPNEVVRRLARHDEIMVAGPVLSQSACITSNDLIEIARTKSQEHLLAISERARLEETVTDILVERGDRGVVHRLANNLGAAFSETGYSELVKRAEKDESLALKIGQRLDIPFRLLRELLSKATEAVRARLLALAPPESEDQIQRALAAVSNEIIEEATAPRDFTRAQDLVRQMHRLNHLNDEAVLKFANNHQYEEIVAALSELCSVPLDLIEQVMQYIHCDGLIIVCKAAELKWATLRAIMEHRVAHHAIPAQELSQAKADFIRLSKATAQRTLRFWQVRGIAQSGAEPSPEAAEQLMQVLRALDIDPAALDKTEPMILRALQLRCVTCKSKAECQDAVTSGRIAEGYQHFCANADSLDALMKRSTKPN
jgi:uncharacterized protein (DUF2336 family)